MNKLVNDSDDEQQIVEPEQQIVEPVEEIKQPEP